MLVLGVLINLELSCLQRPPAYPNSGPGGFLIQSLVVGLFGVVYSLSRYCGSPNIITRVHGMERG